MISILIPNAQEEKIHELISMTELCYPEAQIIIATDRDRKGKGWAMRQALSQAKGDIVVFLDGDMDIHPIMLHRLLPHLDEFDIVCGKKDPGFRFDRKVLTILSRMYIRILFGIKVDTQTGIKVFRRESLPVWGEDGFAFDIEILAKAKRLGFTMYDLGIEAKCDRKMKIGSIWATLIASFRIWYNLVNERVFSYEG